jgi:hypothetical protein
MVKAEPYYEIEDIYKKSYGKDVSVKATKCNNINSNNNGLKGNVEIPNNDAILETQAADDNQIATTNDFGNVGENNNKYKQNDELFSFVCINITIM